MEPSGAKRVFSSDVTGTLYEWLEPRVNRLAPTGVSADNALIAVQTLADITEENCRSEQNIEAVKTAVAIIQKAFTPLQKAKDGKGAGGLPLEVTQEFLETVEQCFPDSVTKSKTFSFAQRMTNSPPEAACWEL